MIKVFDKNSDYAAYVNGGLISGELYWVEEDKSVHFRTNNIDGSDKVYNIGVGDDLVPAGNLAITANGTDIDVAEYATASVNVPIPDGYIQPTGNYAISENGTDIDVAQYATVSVSVSGGGSTPALTWLNSTTTSAYGVEVEPGAACTAPLTVGKTYRIHFDGADYSSALRKLYVWAYRSEGGEGWTVGEIYLGEISSSLNNFDFTILPFLTVYEEGDMMTYDVSNDNVRLVVMDGEGSSTYSFRYAELPSYPAGGPSA